MMRHKLFALATAFVLAACGGDDKTGPDDGGNDNGGNTTASYSATISGDVTKSLSGSAAFGHGDLGGGQEGFAIGMGAETDAVGVVIARIDGDRPGTGTYAIEDMESGQGFIGMAYAEEGNMLFLSTSGEFEVTKSTDSRLEGTFEFEAIGMNAANPETELTVTVKGSFKANGAEIETTVASIER